MSVLTIQPPTITGRTQVHYADMTDAQQAAFDAAMESVADAINPVEVALASTTAILAAGLNLPAGTELAQCTCTDCTDCGLIFAAAQAHITTEATIPVVIEVVQCPACFEDHPHPAE